MPNTSNFNWPTPADTDLVKDGAAAIRNLGNGVDTSLVDLKGGTTGQILSKASNTDMDFTWTAGGDITEVQAGTGISIASGTGPIPVVTNTVATAFDAAGDLVYGTGADTFTKLGIGTANQVLAVNSGATAPEWKTVGAAGMTLITRQSISNSGGTNIDSVFTSTYRTYLIVVENMESSSAQADIFMQLRFGSSTKASGYKYQQMAFSNTYTGTEKNGISELILNLNTGGTNDGSAGQIMLTRVGNASERPYFWSEFVDIQTGVPLMTNGIVNESETYTGVRFSLSTGNFTGIIAIYGLAKS